MRIQDLNKTGEAIFQVTMSMEEARQLAEACYFACLLCDQEGVTHVDTNRLREMGAILRRARSASLFHSDGSARATA